ncbi:MAG TPA: YcaO-like family protein [Geminicoccaceae bacterium]|nr:YcaO-like family protein [Geminicoccaceae bacterium]
MAGSAPSADAETVERAVPPAATVARVRPLMARMGITRLADVTGLDRIGLPVFSAIRPSSRSVAVSQGKGLTADAARAAALMEAVESWHAETIEAPLRLASAAELARRSGTVAVDRLPRRADARFDPDQPLLWIEGRHMVTGEPVWLPYELVHTDYRLPQPPAAGCFPVSTNGLAAGNTRDEAVRHALCELIERDALSLWHQLHPRARQGTAIDQATVEDAGCRAVLDRLAETGFAVALFDLTSDLAVPAFLALLVDRRDAAGHPGLGSACHPRPATALLKALLEAVQVRTGYIAGARDDLTPEEFDAAGPVEKLRWLGPLLEGAEGARRLAQAEPAAGGGGPAAQVGYLLGRLAATGLGEAVAVDLTRPEFDLPVVRVVVPGLEACADDPGYAPGARASAARAAR